MKMLQSCEFNMDTNRVELLYTDGTMIAIDTIAILPWKTSTPRGTGLIILM